MPNQLKPAIQHPWAWKNGQWLPLAEAGPSLADTGWVQGATVVDLLRTYGGKPFLPDRHLDRFFHDCHALGIVPRWDRRVLEQVILELLEKNQVGTHPHQAWCIVLLATPGPLAHYGTRETPGATQIIHGYPLPRDRYMSWFSEGARLAVSSVVSACPGPVDPRIKHRSRLHWWQADHLGSRENPGAVQILLTDEGHVTESSIGHVAMVSTRGGKDTLVIPPPELVLRGISLGLVLEMAEKIGLPVERSRFGWRELQGAREVILTGSAFGLAPVSQVGRVTLPFPGDWTAKLLKLWEEQAGEPVQASFV